MQGETGCGQYGVINALFKILTAQMVKVFTNNEKKKMPIY